MANEQKPKKGNKRPGHSKALIKSEFVKKKRISVILTGTDVTILEQKKGLKLGNEVTDRDVENFVRGQLGLEQRSAKLSSGKKAELCAKLGLEATATTSAIQAAMLKKLNGA